MSKLKQSATSLGSPSSLPGYDLFAATAECVGPHICVPAGRLRLGVRPGSAGAGLAAGLGSEPLMRLRSEARVTLPASQKLSVMPHRTCCLYRHVGRFFGQPVIAHRLRRCVQFNKIGEVMREEAYLCCPRPNSGRHVDAPSHHVSYRTTHTNPRHTIPYIPDHTLPYILWWPYRPHWSRLV